MTVVGRHVAFVSRRDVHALDTHPRIGLDDPAFELIDQHTDAANRLVFVAGVHINDGDAERGLPNSHRLLRVLPTINVGPRGDRVRTPALYREVTPTQRFDDRIVVAEYDIAAHGARELQTSRARGVRGCGALE
jgi:hypothetical protein